MHSVGNERRFLIASSFPHTISVSKCEINSSLRISYSEKFESYVISDHEGFLTLIETVTIDDHRALIHAILVESKRKGAFREEVTGKEAPKSPPLLPTKKKGGGSLPVFVQLHVWLAFS